MMARNGETLLLHRNQGVDANRSQTKTTTSTSRQAINDTRNHLLRQNNLLYPGGIPA